MAKGREGENGPVAFLIKHGWPHAERRAKAGAKDRGDIAGVAGVCIEAKNEKTINLAGYMGELEAEMSNTGAGMGFVVVKRRGFPFKTGDPEATVDNVGEWYAVLPMRLMVQLLKEAGY